MVKRIPEISFGDSMFHGGGDGLWTIYVRKSSDQYAKGRQCVFSTKEDSRLGFSVSPNNF